MIHHRYSGPMGKILPFGSLTFPKSNLQKIRLHGWLHSEFHSFHMNDSTMSSSFSLKAPVTKFQPHLLLLTELITRTTSGASSIFHPQSPLPAARTAKGTADALSSLEYQYLNSQEVPGRPCASMMPDTQASLIPSLASHCITHHEGLLSAQSCYLSMTTVSVP